MPKFAQGCHDCFYPRDPCWQHQGGWKTGGGKPLRMPPPLCRRARARLVQGEGNDGRYFLLFLLFCPLCLLVTSLLPDGSLLDTHLPIWPSRVSGCSQYCRKPPVPFLLCIGTHDLPWILASLLHARAPMGQCRSAGPSKVQGLILIQDLLLLP